jgi:hypothetical protein
MDGHERCGKLAKINDDDDDSIMQSCGESFFISE